MKASDHETATRTDYTRDVRELRQRKLQIRRSESETFPLTSHDNAPWIWTTEDFRWISHNRAPGVPANEDIARIWPDSTSRITPKEPPSCFTSTDFFGGPLIRYGNESEDCLGVPFLPISEEDQFQLSPQGSTDPQSFETGKYNEDEELSKFFDFAKDVSVEMGSP